MSVPAEVAFAVQRPLGASNQVVLRALGESRGQARKPEQLWAPGTLVRRPLQGRALALRVCWVPVGQALPGFAPIPAFS